MAQEPTGMVECHVSGKVFVKKLKTKPRRRNRPRGLFFYLPYTFTGSQQNELYFNTLVLIIRSLVRLSQGNYRLHGTRPNILELFDYKLLYRGSGRCHSNTITIPLSLSHDCLYSFFTFNSYYNYALRSSNCCIA